MAIATGVKRWEKAGYLFHFYFPCMDSAVVMTYSFVGLVGSLFERADPFQ